MKDRSFNHQRLPIPKKPKKVLKISRLPRVGTIRGNQAAASFAAQFAAEAFPPESVTMLKPKVTETAPGLFNVEYRFQFNAKEGGTMDRNLFSFYVFNELAAAEKTAQRWEDILKIVDWYFAVEETAIYAKLAGAGNKPPFDPPIPGEALAKAEALLGRSYQDGINEGRRQALAAVPEDRTAMAYESGLAEGRRMAMASFAGALEEAQSEAAGEGAITAMETLVDCLRVDKTIPKDATKAEYDSRMTAGLAEAHKAREAERKAGRVAASIEQAKTGLGPNGCYPDPSEVDQGTVADAERMAAAVKGSGLTLELSAESLDAVALDTTGAGYAKVAGPYSQWPTVTHSRLMTFGEVVAARQRGELPPATVTGYASDEAPSVAVGADPAYPGQTCGTPPLGHHASLVERETAPVDPERFHGFGPNDLPAKSVQADTLKESVAFAGLEIVSRSVVADVAVDELRSWLGYSPASEGLGLIESTDDEFRWRSPSGQALIVGRFDKDGGFNGLMPLNQRLAIEAENIPAKFVVNEIDSPNQWVEPASPENERRCISNPILTERMASARFAVNEWDGEDSFELLGELCHVLDVTYFRFGGSFFNRTPNVVNEGEGEDRWQGRMLGLYREAADIDEPVFLVRNTRDWDTVVKAFKLLETLAAGRSEQGETEARELLDDMRVDDLSGLRVDVWASSWNSVEADGRPTFEGVQGWEETGFEGPLGSPATPGHGSEVSAERSASEST